MEQKGTSDMRRKIAVRLGLAIVLTAAIFYAIFVFQLPQLIWASLKLGIAPSWPAFHEYMDSKLIGLTMNEVHSVLEGLDPSVQIGQLSYRRTGKPCEVTRIFRFEYTYCYSDDPLREKRLVAVEPPP